VIFPIWWLSLFYYLKYGKHVHVLVKIFLKNFLDIVFSCELGVSGKSVLLYAIVFTCRYLDLFTHFVSLYNSVMKIIYLVSTFFTLYLIYRKFKATYDRNHDTFRIEFLILPSAVLALIWNHEYSVLEVCI
jgi:ER lumen protein retaining receptor